MVAGAHFRAAGRSPLRAAKPTLHGWRAAARRLLLGARAAWDAARRRAGTAARGGSGGGGVSVRGSGRSSGSARQRLALYT
jgi:hypothetical protein